MVGVVIRAFVAASLQRTPARVARMLMGDSVVKGLLPADCRSHGREAIEYAP